MFSKKKNNYYLLKIFFINYLLFIKLCLTLPTIKNLRQIAIPRIADHMINIGNLTRQHGGDIFDAYDVQKCDTDTCVGLSSGTAKMYVTAIKEIDMSKIKSDTETDCRCQCLPYMDTYREDLGICVDDIHECSLAPFVSGSTTEKIPFVFLPLRGQIIHPSREISFLGVLTPICAVSGAQFLTKTGWSELRNQLDSDVPFRLFRDEGRTFLQWIGESDLRQRMQGRLVLVHLMCRDMQPITTVNSDGNLFNNGDEELNDQIGGHGLLKKKPNIFTPCVAFRIVGTPSKYANNVTEVIFSSEIHTDPNTTGNGLTTKEYIVIGLCSLLLGLIYVASVFLYLHMKKRKLQNNNNAELNGNTQTVNTMKNDNNYNSNNDQIIYGQGYGTRGDNFTTFLNGPTNGNNTSNNNNNNNNNHTNTSNNNMQRNNNNNQRINMNQNQRHNLTNNNINSDDMIIIKNNPLLKHYPNLSDNSGFMSDLSNSNSECDDDRMKNLEKLRNQLQTSAMIHPSMSNLNGKENEGSHLHDASSSSPHSETECIPEENVSIVEDLSSEDKLENMKNIINGTMRRKLYFNPAYFEPHLLMSPPPAAIEFLNKIREVITIAKYKMATKRFQPSLIVIPEEHQNLYEARNNSRAAVSRRDSALSSKPENNRKTKQTATSCSGCPGCSERQSNDGKTESNCKNCGDKRNSIQKWLEGVSTNNNGETNSDPERDANNFNEIKTQQTIDRRSVNSDTSSSDNDTVIANSIKSKRSSTKGKAPSIPNSMPKIVSHSLKENNSEAGDEVKSNEMKNQTKNDIYGSYRLNENRNPYEKPTEVSLYIRNNLAALKESEAKKLYDKVELYNKITKSAGSEIYNNPSFDQTSPHLSHKSKSSKRSSLRSRGSKRRIEVLDQFANPAPPPTVKPQIEKQKHYEMLKNLHKMPDMVFEALAKDYNQKNFDAFNTRVIYDKVVQSSPSPIYQHIQLPTPDYNDDDIYSKKLPSIKSFSDAEDPYVPTPDYNTYGRTSRSGKHYQPDSPIYTRKNPHYLIVDYETDSLERTTSAKSRGTLTPPSTSNNSDLSSQPSPSLSTALPLEEEVEIRNAVYDRIEGFRKDTDSIQKSNKLYEDVNGKSNNYIGKQNSFRETKIKYNTPFAGSMTIEVEHSPQESEVSTDSDQFEPDTLDRKHKKNKHTNNNQNKINNNNNQNPLNRVSRYQDEQSYFIPNHFRKSDYGSYCRSDKPRYSSLENMTSLPDLHDQDHHHSTSIDDIGSKVILKSTGSFRNDSFGRNIDIGNILNNSNKQRSFSSLREIYEARNPRPNFVRTNIDHIDVSDKGRILTLEARHSKRQRKNNEEIIKKLIPPDVVPFENNTSYYDNPKTPISVDSNNLNELNVSKNSQAPWKSVNEKHYGRSQSFYDQGINSYRSKRGCNGNENGNDTCETTSTTSESTEFTAVSDTLHNSEYESDRVAAVGAMLGHAREVKRTVAASETNDKKKNINSDTIQSVSSNGSKGKKFMNTKSMGILESFMNIGDTANQRFIDHVDTLSLRSGTSNRSKINKKSSKDYDDPDKIEVISSRSLSNHTDSIRNYKNDGRILSELTSKFQPDLNHMNAPKIFRLEINQPTNGMQIAMGLRDRVKKTKDIKNAWKRFINLASSKLTGNGNGSNADKVSSIYSDNSEKDEGISSLIDENFTMQNTDRNNINSGNVKRDILLNRSKSMTSNDISDSGYISADSNDYKNRKIYERYNFKHNALHRSLSTIEDKDIDTKFNQLTANEDDNAATTDKIVIINHTNNQQINNNNNITNNQQFILEINDNKVCTTNKLNKNLNNNNKNYLQTSDDESYSSGLSSETEQDSSTLDGNCDDETYGGESGAESIETHSVFFKQVRKN